MLIILNKFHITCVQSRLVYREIIDQLKIHRNLTYILINRLITHRDTSNAILTHTLARHDRENIAETRHYIGPNSRSNSSTTTCSATRKKHQRYKENVSENP